MVLIVPHVDQVSAETIAGATSEDDMERQTLCCFGAEVEERRVSSIMVIHLCRSTIMCFYRNNRVCGLNYFPYIELVTSEDDTEPQPLLCFGAEVGEECSQ